MAWLPTIDVDISARKLCRALFANAVATYEVDRAVRRLGDYGPGAIHQAIEVSHGGGIVIESLPQGRPALNAACTNQ